MVPIGQFEVDGCHLDGGDHQGGRQGGGTGVAWNVGAGVLVSYDHVSDNMCSWTIGEETVFIEMMVDE